MARHEGERREGEEQVRPPPGSRRQPPTALSLKTVNALENNTCQMENEGSNRDSATSGSLNLSQHNTETQVDF